MVPLTINIDEYVTKIIEGTEINEREKIFKQLEELERYTLKQAILRNDFEFIKKAKEPKLYEYKIRYKKIKYRLFGYVKKNKYIIIDIVKKKSWVLANKEMKNAQNKARNHLNINN